MNHFDSTNDFCDSQIDHTVFCAQRTETTAHDENIINISEALSRILQWCFLPFPERKRRGSARGASLRFISMVAVIRPDLMEGKSYDKIAKSLGVTKKVISKHAVEFNRAFRIHSRRNRTVQARKDFLDRHFEKFRE